MLKGLLIIFLAFAKVSHSFPKVTMLTTSNYNVVMKSKDYWLIEFYSKRCGTCQEFEPIWEEVLEKLKGIKIGRVDIDEEEGMKLASKLDVLKEGIPNVSLNYKGKLTSIMTGRELMKSEELIQEINKKVTHYKNEDL